MNHTVSPSPAWGQGFGPAAGLPAGASFRQCSLNAIILAFVLALSAATGAFAQFTAAVGSPFAVGSSPRSVAAADFDGNGKPDLVTANFSDNTVSVLLGNGSGGFTAASGSPFSVGTSPQSVAVGDFNGDGKPDVVTANSGGNNITVLLGNGSGGFTAALGSPFAVGSSPAFAAVGDFNGDGKLDIAVSNSADNNITVLLGDGSGGFTAAPGSPLAAGTNPSAIAVADFNADGKLDIVVANSGGNNVTVLLGNGLGGFTPAAGSPFSLGLNPAFVAVGDFNSDGRLDIVTANTGDNTITELLGNGSGGFSAGAGTLFGVGVSPASVVVGDFNGDGNLDVAEANSGGNTLLEFPGDGMGGFTPSAGSPFTVGIHPASIAVADFNGDGKPDMAIANFSDATVSILLNTLPAITANLPSVAFYAAAGHAAPANISISMSSSTSGSTYNASSNQSWLAPSPASNATGGVTTIHLSATATSLPAGMYTGTVRYTAPNFFDAATAVMFNVANPSGTVQAAAASPFTVGGSPQSVAVGDFNGDGKSDLVTANGGNSGGNNVTVLLSDGAGGFTAAAGSPFAVGAAPQSVAVLDLNGDGTLDIVAANSVANSVSVLLGNGTGGFTTAAGGPFAVGTTPQSVAVGDFNGDGRPDIVTANNGSGDVTVLLGDGTGGFLPAPGSPFAAGLFPQSVAVGDFNGDGRADLVAAISGTNTIRVLLGNGYGGFTGGVAVTVGSFPQFVTVADLNGDGKLDIVTANSAGNSVSVLLGNGSGGFTAASGSPFAVGTNPESVSVADINGDGKPDILAANVGSNNVTVLLGNGSGGFAAAAGSPFAAGTTPASIAVADFNGDGRPDIALPSVGGGTVTVLLGTQAATTSVLSTTAGSTITYGTAVPLTLAVSTGGFNAPGGTAAFLDGGSTIATAAQMASPYSFSATGLQAGAHSLTASYNGDPATAASMSNTLSITVSQASQTLTFGTLATKALSVAPFTVSAAASSGLAVVFTSTTSSVCAASGATVTLLTVGQCTIQASQPGNANFSAATSVSQSFTVTQGSQTITFGALANQAFGSNPFSISATASSGLVVTFASTSLTVCTVAGTTVTLVSQGTCTIKASQAGDANYAAAAAVSQHFSVTASGQTIAFSALSDQPFGTAPFPVSATASSGLAVSFASTTVPVCTVVAAMSGTTVKLVSAGSCTIKATQAGNSSYGAAPPVSQSFNVTPAVQTLTFGALTDRAFGAAPFTVSVTSSSGLAVSLLSLTPAVCATSGTTGTTVTLVSVGTCTVEASQPGNANYLTATPVDQSFAVSQAAQTITFATLSNKTIGTIPFTINATASSGLPVSFASNSGVCTVSGNSVSLNLGGTCTIQATQGGNTNYSPATPVAQSFTVTAASQTITFGAISGKVFGSGPVQVSATASSGLTVAFTATTSSVCTASGTVVTLVSAGTCTIQATQPGNSFYAAAPSVNQKFTVTTASQTITFPAIPSQALGTGPLALSASVSSGLTLSFTSSTTSVCTVSGGAVALLAKGTCTIQASQPGNSSYAAAKAVSQTFTVTAGTLTIQSVLNAGSYAAMPMASDAYTVAFGTYFSTTVGQTSSYNLPATLAGATVTVADSNGVTQTAPLFYVSPTQINFLVPQGLANGSATITVTNPVGTKASFAMNIAPVSPALFTADSSGQGAPAALVQSFASGADPQVTQAFNCTVSPLVCLPTPIDLGPSSTSVYLVLFGTGIRGRSGLSGVTATVGSAAQQVTFAGAQTTYPGLDQVNVLLDRSLIGKGQLTLQLTVDGLQANPVTVNIK